MVQSGVMLPLNPNALMWSTAPKVMPVSQPDMFLFAGLPLWYLGQLFTAVSVSSVSSTVSFSGSVKFVTVILLLSSDSK